MARGRGGSRRTVRDVSTDARRDAIGSLTRSVLPGLFVEPPSPLSIEDRRFWHPDPDRGAITLGGRFARVVVHKRPPIAFSKSLYAYRGLPRGIQVPVGVRFESPLKVVTCIRRKIRREVILARGHGGKGKRHRVPRRTWRSNVGC